ncbi:MAG: adenylate/guanylate cyclase domain-containing protein, partial [Candidatus Aureabacteria bacterium]|nr:adenylate/guanylate cyclase domain-containing protein [Candidatus Auribacterota bacterium]
MTVTQRKIVSGTAVGLGAALVALLLWFLGALDRWENATWAWRVKTFARPSAATSRIKIILLDQQSLDWGKNESGLSWPWPREVYGPLLDFCRRAEAKAIAFDVLYTEPSASGVGDDARFGESIRRSVPFAGALALARKKAGVDAWPKTVPLPPFQTADLRRYTDYLEYPWATFPIPEVYSGAAILGNVMEPPDPDSIFRRAAPLSFFDEKAVPSLGLAAYLAPFAEGEEEPFPELRRARGELRVGEKRIPLDPLGRTILRYRGTIDAYAPVTASSVILSELKLQAGEKPLIDPALFQDCYVFFGFSAPGLLDLRSTPLSPVAPGVMIHATLLDNLLAGDFIRDAPPLLVIPIVLLLSVLAGVAGVVAKKSWQNILCFFIFLPVAGAVGLAAYPLGFWWPVMTGAIAVALALVGAVVLNYATEGRQKRFIKSAFQQYLSGEVIDEILLHPERLQLGGEKRELSLFFSDLEKFSSFSERLDPPTLTALLNDYLSDMTDIIMEEGGTLDKFVGDAIVAFWNAPVEQADHAVRACRAALRCQRKLDERREEFEKRTTAVLKNRIGINTGAVTVGNLGSRSRFAYTVLGDAANLASRLEGANKAF